VTLSEEQVLRYSRNIVLDQVGKRGQIRLLNSSVLVVGTGGLGSPVSYYLAAAGVGRIGLVDGDVVDLSNLQRQILHSTRDIGRQKVFSAREKLLALNPDITVSVHECMLSEENADALVGEYDVVVDATDNFAARYIINDACVRAGRYMVHGSIFRFEGQVTVFGGGGPCYRCIYPAAPPPDVMPTCAQVGVLGAVPGVIGSIQALEVLKILLDAGRTLSGRLILFNGLSMEFMEVEAQPDPGCTCRGGTRDAVIRPTYNGCQKGNRG